MRLFTLLLVAFFSTTLYAQTRVSAVRHPFDSTINAWGDTDRVVNWELYNTTPFYREELQHSSNSSDRYVYTNWVPLHPKSMSNATFDYDDFVDWVVNVDGFTSTRDTLSGWFFDRWVPRTVVARTVEGEFLTEITIDQDPAGGGFNTVSRIVYEYDAQDNLQAWELWNLRDQSLKQDVREINEIRYNSSDQILSIKRYGYYEGQRIEDDSQVYAYDVSGRIKEITLYPAGSTRPSRLLRGIVWHDPYRMFRYDRALPIFNGNNGYTEYFIDKFDTLSQAWVPYIQIKQQFDGGLPVRYERRMANDDGVYVVTNYDSLSYYPNGDPKAFFEYRLDDNTMVLYSAVRFENTYGNGRLLTSEQEEWAYGVGWTKTYRYAFTYFQGAVEQSSEVFTLAGDVTDRFIHVQGLQRSGEEILVVDILGDVVLRQSVTEPLVHLDLYSLPAGVYYLTYGETRRKILKIGSN